MDHRGGGVGRLVNNRGGGIRSRVDRSIGSGVIGRGVMDYRGRVIGGGSMNSVMHWGMHCVMDWGMHCMMDWGMDRMMDRVSHGVDRMSQVRGVVTMSHESAVMTVVDYVGRDVSHGGRVSQSNQSQHTRKSLELFIEFHMFVLFTVEHCNIIHDITRKSKSRYPSTLYLHFCDVALK